MSSVCLGHFDKPIQNQTNNKFPEQEKRLLKNIHFWVKKTCLFFIHGGAQQFYSLKSHLNLFNPLTITPEIFVEISNRDQTKMC